MKNLQTEEILQEIYKLRENLHKIYNENKKVTKEVLLVSSKLDHSINSYVKLLNEESSN
jgi:ribosomal protein S17E